MHIQPAGRGASAVKYLGAYVARTAIGDGRIVRVADRTVTFRWKNRDARRTERLTLPGVEFVGCYLRHVLPRGMRSIRYYGFCHPAARERRLRVQLHSGRPVHLGAALPLGRTLNEPPRCPRCHKPMTLQAIFIPCRQRGPPRIDPSPIQSLSA